MAEDKVLVERRENVPHVAVLHISYEVHEKLPSGELRGMPVTRGTRISKVEGEDRFICLRNLNELLASIHASASS
jgi:hypothetical protein